MIRFYGYTRSRLFKTSRTRALYQLRRQLHPSTEPRYHVLREETPPGQRAGYGFKDKTGGLSDQLNTILILTCICYFV